MPHARCGLIIDYARKRRAHKRGRHLEITLVGDEEPSSAPPAPRTSSRRLGDALGELGELEPGLAEVVDLHFFCGFSFAERELRHVSERTVQREWRKARLLLHEGLQEE